jgi:hypothetical protein
MKWIECRGGFTHFHPPPEKKIQAFGKNRKIKETNKALSWSKVFATILIINVPPPHVVQ